MNASFRLWLVLLLALALPLRGALAAAQHCAGAAGAAHVHAVAGQVASTSGHGSAGVEGSMDEPSHAHGSHGGHGATPTHVPSHAPEHATVHAQAHADPTTHAQAHPASGSPCSDCASCCAAPAILSSTTLIPRAGPVAAVFPEPAYPAPQFVPSGDERPPRLA